MSPENSDFIENIGSHKDALGVFSYNVAVRFEKCMAMCWVCLNESLQE